VGACRLVGGWVWWGVVEHLKHDGERSCLKASSRGGSQKSWRILLVEHVTISGTFLQTWKMYKGRFQGTFYSLYFLWGRICCRSD
jgi:hypothetical protein